MGTTMSEPLSAITLSLVSTLVAYTSASCLSTRCRLFYAAGALTYIALAYLLYHGEWNMFSVFVLWFIGIPVLLATLMQIRQVRHSRFPKWYRAWSVAYPVFLTLLTLMVWGYYLVAGKTPQVPVARTVLLVLNLTYWVASLLSKPRCGVYS